MKGERVRQRPHYAVAIQDAALFLIRDENRASNWRNLKTPAFRFRVTGKHFKTQGKAWSLLIMALCDELGWDQCPSPYLY